MSDDTINNDTGLWKDSHGEVFFVVQKSDGSVVCNSEKYFTSASARTWKIWKTDHGWTRVESRK